MGKKKKENRIVVTLEDPNDKRSRYVTTKNRKNTPDRLVRRKFNRFKRCYTEHREIK